MSIDRDDAQPQRYSDAYLSDYDFERVLVRIRQNVTAGLLPTAARKIIEIGCGAELLVERIPDRQVVTHWVIVEPDRQFVATVADRVSTLPFVTLIEGAIQDTIAEVLARSEGSSDVVICSSLLHELDDPLAVLKMCRELLADDGRLIVNVPNAGSLHRRLAVAMGVIDSPFARSARNEALNQPWVFDAASLREIVCSAGFEVVDEGGYFLKPFTHAQMAELPFLDDEMLEGLQRLGTELVDLASEIYLVAMPRNDTNG